MPVYEYVCQDCQKAFEISRAMSEVPAKDVKCPSCGSTRTERVYSGIYAKTSRKS